jgi:glutamyl-tRNA reductase
LENQSTTRNTKKNKNSTARTQHYSPPFLPSVSSQNINKTETPIQQAHKQIRQNIASFLEISQKEKRTHLRAQQQANIKLKKLENPWHDFCEIGDFVSWKALPEENESCWRVSAM